MKKSYRYIMFLIMVILLCGECALSRIDNVSSIRHIAQNFLNHKKSMHTQTLIKQIDYTIDRMEQLIKSSDNTVLAYIVKVKPKGFLIISPQLDQDPVIAYSFRHNWHSGITEDHPLYYIITMDLKLRGENSDQLSSKPIRLIM